jgi:hypothetical protein
VWKSRRGISTSRQRREYTEISKEISVCGTRSNRRETKKRTDESENALQVGERRREAEEEKMENISDQKEEHRKGSGEAGRFYRKRGTTKTLVHTSVCGTRSPLASRFSIEGSSSSAASRAWEGGRIRLLVFTWC